MIKSMPEGEDRYRKELTPQAAIGAPLIAMKGYGALEVEHAYTRALELCELIGDRPEFFWVL